MTCDNLTTPAVQAPRHGLSNLCVPNAHTNLPRRRGTIILMVVGILTIIAMLGGIFLMITRMDTQQSRAMAQREQVDPVAAGLITKIQALLQKDLNIGSGSTPYSGLSANANNADGWSGYMDYNSNATGDDYLNKYLAQLATNDGTQNRAYTTYSNLDLTQISQFNTSGTGKYADTWGRSTNTIPKTDAELYDAGITAPDGTKYYYAINLQDTSSMINLNTACSNDAGDILTTISPANISLKSLLAAATSADTTYTNLYFSKVNNYSRCYLTTGSAPAVSKYDNDVVRQLLSPQNSTSVGYFPYAVSDEVFLRWLTPLTTLPYPYSSIRIGQALPYNTVGLNWRALLTTWSCSRALPRHPNDISKLLDPTSETDQAKIYAALNTILAPYYNTDSAGTTARKKAAAAFTCNLLAYRSTSSNIVKLSIPAGTGSADDPASDAFDAYPIPEPELFITEAYARGVRDAGGNLSEFFAIELKNFSTTATAVPGNYKLCLGSTTGGTKIALTGSSINIGDHVVYYTQTGSDGSFPTTTNTTVFRSVSGLDLANKVVLLKTVTIGGSTIDVPVDEIDVTPQYSSPTTSPETKFIDVARDDKDSDYRYAIADAVKTVNGNESLADPQTLGTDNSSESTPSAKRVSLADVKSKATFPVPIRKQSITSIADIFQFYTCGPTLTSSTYSSFPGALTGTDYKAQFPDDDCNRGRFNTKPLRLIPASMTDFSNHKYPDVPMASLLGEVFNLTAADTTRTDDPNHTRIYGRININTAPEEVFKYLPWPTAVIAAGSSGDTDRARLAEFIVAYREGRQAMDTNGSTVMKDYTSRQGLNGADIANLRQLTGVSGGPLHGFTTPGELAIPLADFYNYKNYSSFTYSASTNTPSFTEAQDSTALDYAQNRDSLYAAVANLITVNSDTYVANIIVQLGTGSAKVRWRYLALFDRSNCRKSDDKPAVLLFTEIK